MAPDHGRGLSAGVPSSYAPSPPSFSFPMAKTLSHIDSQFLGHQSWEGLPDPQTLDEDLSFCLVLGYVGLVSNLFSSCF